MGVAAQQVEQRVHGEQIKILARFAPFQINAHAGAGALVVALSWEHAPHPALIGWYAVLLACVAPLVPTAIRVSRDPTAAIPDRTRAIVQTQALVMGAVWGVGALLVFPHLPFDRVTLLLMIYSGILAGALASGVYTRHFYLLCAASGVPGVIALLLAGTPEHNQLAALVATYVVLIMVYARWPIRALGDVLRAQVDNQVLVEELRVQKAQAEQASAAKSKFLAAASHDLRQPLHALMLFTTALDEKARDPSLAPILEQIRTSASTMEELFNAILDISKLDANVVRPERSVFRLADVGDRLTNDFDPDARAKGLLLTNTLADVRVASDEPLLERILRNFLANAIRYTDEGSVVLRSVEADDTVRIDVVDTGLGIPADKQRVIFEEFQQLDNPERDRSKGLGLGLAIVARLAELLGHTIDVDSAPGRGSRFSVTVPRASSAPASAAYPDGAVQQPLIDVCVLVIDDEPAIRRGMQTLLETWGCEVLLAADADDALAQIADARLKPDALIVDYRLPGGHTGLEAIDSVYAALPTRPPALLVTGDIEAAELQAVAAGEHPVAHKPVPPANLRAFLTSVRRRDGAHSGLRHQPD